MKTIFTFLFSLFALSSYCQTIAIQTFASGFSSPIALEHPPGDTRMFVVQQGGAIRIVNPNGTINPNNFLTLTTSTIITGSERGLLGLAFHPNYATNGYFYVNYTRAGDGATVIARYQVSANPDLADATSGTVLLTVAQPYSNHNGGTIRFGTDGYLYIGMGDGGLGGDPENRSQNILENLGKILRIDVDSASPYGIPPTNPYVGIAGNDEIWAVGVRNPWKFSFDMQTNDLWLADVGQDNYEEVNYVAAPVPTTLNFGWDCYEATHVYTAGCAVGTTTYTFPITEYTHSVGCSITGGYVYRGSTYPNFAGKFFFGDYCTNKIGMVDTAGNVTWSSTGFSGTGITTFGQDINGEIYVAGNGTGIISKVKDSSLGLASFGNTPLQLFPNPASSEFYIKSSGLSYPASVNIYDITGKLLLNQNIIEETHAVATSTLPSGLYMVSVKDNAGVTSTSKLSIR